MAGSLGVTVLPKDDSLQRAIADIVAGYQNSQAERARLAQQESQFSRSHDLATRQTQSLIDTNTASVENANMQTLGQRADAITKGLFATADDLARKGEKPEEIQAFIVKALKNFSDDPGPDGTEKPPALKALNYEVRSRLVAQLTQQPDTPGGRMVRGALETGAAATERAATGSQNPIDVDWARRVSTGESLSAPAFGYQDTAEQGPEAVKAAVAIADDRAAGATPQLQARTQQSIAAADNATSLQIAREGAANARTIAGMRADGSAPGVTEAQNAQKQEAIRLIDELLSHPGRESGSGASGMIARNFPATDARGFASKIERLKAIMTLDNLKLLKGAMSDKDLLFLQSIPAALDLGMADDEVKSELVRARDTLKGVKQEERETPDGKRWRRVDGRWTEIQ